MMRKQAAWLLVACALALSACLGCHPDNAPWSGTTVYVGAYAGPWHVPGTTDAGVLTLTVGEDATLRGTFTNFGNGETGIITGRTNEQGVFDSTFTVDITGEKIVVKGLFATGGSRDKLSGDGTFQRAGGATRGFTFDAARTAGDPSPFAGPYSGPWSVPGTTEAGQMTLTISQNGQISGTFTDAGTSTAGSVTGNVVNDGTFSAAMIENGGQRIAITGTMANMPDGGLAGDGTFMRPGGSPQGFTFTFPAPTGGTGG